MSGAEPEKEAVCGQGSDDEEQDVEDDQWDDWNESGDEEDEPAKSLFGPEIVKSPQEAFEHDARVHGFDLRQFAIQERLDDYGIFRCINFIRREVAAGRDPRPQLAAGSGRTAAWATGEEFLKPVMQEDALLFFDYEDIIAQAGEGPASAGQEQGPDAEVQQLRAENAALKDALAELRAVCMPEEFKEELLNDAGPSTKAPPAAAAGEASTSAAAASAPSTSAPAASNKPAAAAAAGAKPGSAVKEVDGAYFDSYSGFGIHKEMISDKPRTDAYQQALERNPSLVKGKAVMDVGCGTGILSLFACRAGAARVVSVDGSERIASFARKICKLNGYSAEDGGPMSVVCGKLEEIKDMPVDKVDVIVSEWMGYALLFETMLDTVLHARDRFLKPGGALLPDIATIFAAGAGRGACDVDFWKDVYGFNMSPIAEEMYKDELDTANVLPVKPEHVVTEAVTLRELDLCTMKSEDQDFTAEFTLRAPASAGPTTAEVHAVVVWFDTAFSARHCADHPVVLSTAPSAPHTHWAQTVLLLKEPVTLRAGGALAEGAATAECITGRLSMVRNTTKHRSLDISMEYKAVLSDGRTVQHAGIYAMNVLS